MTNEQIRAQVAALSNRWPWTSSDFDAAEIWREDIRELAAELDEDWGRAFCRAVQSLIADPQQYGRPDYKRIEARMESLRGKQLHPRGFKPDPKIELASIKSAGDLLYEWRVNRFGKVER